jgi:hypothetical protein
MVELRTKDLEFKQSPKFPGSINFTLAANALENTIYKRTNNERDERTIIGILIQYEASTPNSLEWVDTVQFHWADVMKRYYSLDTMSYNTCIYGLQPAISAIIPWASTIAHLDGMSNNDAMTAN